MVEGDGHLRGLLDIGIALGVNRDKAVVLDILVDKAHNKCLTHYGAPELVVLILTSAKYLKFVVTVALDKGSNLACKHGDKMFNLKLVANLL